MSGKQESNTAEQNRATHSVNQSVMSLERGQPVMTVCFMGHADEWQAASLNTTSDK